MAYATEAQVRRAALTARTATRKSNRTVIEEASVASRNQHFDVFLSHSITDRQLVRGTIELLRRRQLTVYVDWVSDADLERNGEEVETAATVKARMRMCDSLLYLHSEHSRSSRWCPWELGYFDALKHPEERVFVFPITPDGESYEGQSYLRLYEALEVADFDRLGDGHVRRMLRDALGVRGP
jgi:hypothetical protein